MLTYFNRSGYFLPWKIKLSNIYYLVYQAL